MAAWLSRHNRSMPALVAADVSKSFPSADGRSLTILGEVSLSLEAGQNVAILGPSGSGKSTLLAILGTLDEPTSGRVLLDGVDPSTLDEIALARFRSENIGFVFQEHHLLPQCSVLENVLIPYLADGAAEKENIEHAKALLARVGLAERESHRPAQLSGGERQRTALARALIRQPKVLLADEPTGNLDRTTAETITSLLLELQQEQNTVLVVVTHSLTLAARLQSRYELDQGRLVPHE